MLTLKSYSISLYLVCEMAELMPTRVIGLVDLNDPPGIYQILALVLPPTSTHRHSRARARMHRHTHTHTPSQEKKMNEALGMK